MRVLLIALALLLATLTFAPSVSAEPDPPSCYDRQPIVDGIVVQVWLDRSCQPDVRVLPPGHCTIGDIRYC